MKKDEKEPGERADITIRSHNLLEFSGSQQLMAVPRIQTDSGSNIINKIHYYTMWA